MGAHWVRTSQPEGWNSTEVQWTAHEYKTEWQTVSSQDCLSHSDSLAFIVFWYLSCWPSPAGPMQLKGPVHLHSFFYDLQGTALYFSTQRRNSKSAASQICLPGLWRVTGTAGCSARAAVLTSQPRRDPDAGNVLRWGSQRARAAAVGVPELRLCFVVVMCLDFIHFKESKER